MLEHFKSMFCVIIVYIKPDPTRPLITKPRNPDPDSYWIFFLAFLLERDQATNQMRLVLHIQAYAYIVLSLIDTDCI